MSDERKGELLEEFAQMVNVRIDELNKKGYGATDKFRDARKIHDEIGQCIDTQHQPEIDEKYMREKAGILYEKAMFTPERGGKSTMISILWAEEFVTKIINGV